MSRFVCPFGRSGGIQKGTRGAFICVCDCLFIHSIYRYAIPSSFLAIQINSFENTSHHCIHHNCSSLGSTTLGTSLRHNTPKRNCRRKRQSGGPKLKPGRGLNGPCPKRPATPSYSTIICGPVYNGRICKNDGESCGGSIAGRVHYQTENRIIGQPLQLLHDMTSITDSSTLIFDLP